MSVLQDVRYAFRQLLRSPGVTLAAVLTLGLGIGATTGIFSVANAILLRPPGGVGEFGEFVSIYTSDFSGPQYGGSSVPDIQDFAEGAPALSGVVGYSVIPIVLGTESGVRVPELTLGQAVTDGFFEVLQTPFEVGRAFTAEEARLRSNVVVLGYDFWRHGLDGDTGVIGSVIRLGGSQFTVVGVAAEDFRGLLPGIVPAFYAPGVASGMSRFVEVDRRGARSMFTVGRLTGAATVEQARAQLEVVAGALHGEFPDAWTDVRGEARRVTVLRSSDAIVPPQVRGPVIGFVGLLMAIAVGVLIIGCTNIANLLLARAAARRHEFGVRLALGAGRSRLVRQLLTESVVLAGLGAMLGLAVAWGGTGAVTAIELPLPFDVRLDVAPDLRVLGFAALVTGAAALVFGLAPAFVATRQSLRLMLRQEASGRRRLGVRNVLAAGQVCVVVVLLVAGGLLVRSLQSALSVDPGFEPDGLLFVSLAVDLADRSEEERVLLQRQIVERARALPGVAGASYTSSLPLGAGQGRRSFGVEGYQPGASEDMEIHFSFAGPGYFGVMGTPFVRGRDFDGTDGLGAPHTAIVNGAFAARYLPGGDPVGRRLSSGGTSPLSIEIVGIVEDGKYVTLGEEPRPFVWLAADQ
jgi:predicted permease